MNKIPNRTNFFSNVQKTLFSGLKKLMYKGQSNNEIEELIYIGESKQKDAKNKHFR